jgi:hypothetical protein
VCITTDGDPLVVKRTRLYDDPILDMTTTDTILRTTARPALVGWLFKFVGCIDFHDRLRQGYLRMEVAWLTTNWWHRLFSTLFAMLLTNAFRAYVYESESYAVQHLTFFDVMDQFAWCLTRNTNTARMLGRPRRVAAQVAQTRMPTAVVTVLRLCVCFVDVATLTGLCIVDACRTPETVDIDLWLPRAFPTTTLTILPTS